MNGIIVLDKPESFTSFDAVAVVRKLTGERKIGHTGTLDPMATGVLPILLGRAAKALSFLPDTDKCYEAGFKFGVSTDTEDITGKTLKEDEVKLNITEAELNNALENFTGSIMQVPPMYSAVSVNGQRLYDLARKGIEVEREAREIFVSELTLLSFDSEKNEGKLKIACSKGTYVRTLIKDIAVYLGFCGGIMTSLRRTEACSFKESDAVTLDELKKLAAENNIESVLRPTEKLFSEYISVSVSPMQEKRFKNGGELDLSRLRIPRIRLMQDMPVNVYGEKYIGLGKIDLETNSLKILKLLDLD